MKEAILGKCGGDFPGCSIPIHGDATDGGARCNGNGSRDKERPRRGKCRPGSGSQTRAARSFQ